LPPTPVPQDNRATLTIKAADLAEAQNCCAGEGIAIRLKAAE
jgi:hypothetical protein